MVEYTLEQLLEETTSRQQRPNVAGQTAPGALRRQLEEVWATIDRYVSACLEQRRGVALPNLCSVGWQAVKLRGKPTFRPYFQLADSFCRSYSASPAKNRVFMQDEDLCPIEDFNFSKAAIRFSTRLTKDHVSSGLRGLVQQLGQAVGQGRSVSLEFSFGKLLSEEREVRMAFAPELYIANGLEVPSSGDGLEEHGRRPTVTFASSGPSEMDLRGLTIAGTSALEGSPAASVGSRAASLPSRRRASAGGGSAGGSGAGGSSCGAPGEQQDSPSGAVGSRSDLLRCAYDDALHRKITELETRASEALRDKAEREGQMYQGAAMDARVQAERQAQRRENAAFLEQQIEANRSRRHAEKAASIAEESSTLKPPLIPRLDVAALHRRDVLTSQAKEDHAQELALASGAASGPASARAASPSTIVSQGSRGSAQRELREALDEQVQANKARKEAMKQFERRVEACMLAAESRDTSARREIEQASRVQEREMLGAAWREEAKLRDIRKTIEAIELGKKVPGSKASSAQRQRTLPPWAAEPESGPGSARGEGSSRGPPSSGSLSARRAEAGPLSARGEALGAAALLTLQRKAAAAA